MNCPHWGILPEKRNQYECGFTGKRHNATWDGLAIKSTRVIRMGEEILLDYRPEDRTLETKRLVEQRLKEKSMKAKRAHARIAEVTKAREEGKTPRKQRTVA